MRRIFPVIICLSAFAIMGNAAHAGIIDDIRAEQDSTGNKKMQLSERKRLQLEHQRELQEAARQQREAREAARQEKLKALAEIRAAKEQERAEKLAAIKAAQDAKAAELAEKRAAIEEEKRQVLQAKEAEKQARLEALRIAKEAEEAEKQAKLAAIQAEKQAKLDEEQAAKRAEEEQTSSLHQAWEDTANGWIDTDEGTRPQERQEVDFPSREAPGTLIIDTGTRRLYYILGDNRAIQYGIGVGRPGFEWMGVKSVTRKEEWPDWRPPEEMIVRRPDLPRYMPGGPTNPLGARAMYLGSTLYRIHGSNEPETIGQAVSSGCFRMVNADVIDLYNRVQVGAKVIVR